MFNEDKAIEMAAYLLKKAGGILPHLKLVKFMYLADRESFRLCGDSISGDVYFSLPLGPIPSMSLSLINGECIEEAKQQKWDARIAPKANHLVALQSIADEAQSFEELSRHDKSILDGVFTQFHAMDQWRLSQWTHEHCHEWCDPKGSRLNISQKDILQAVGYDPKVATLIEAENQSLSAVKTMLAQA